MVGHLAPESEPHLATVMHGEGGPDKGPDHKKLRCEQTRHDGKALFTIRAL